MLLWQKLLRAEYHCQPAQPLRRVWRILSLASSRRSSVIRLPWGHDIALNPRELIGRSIVALNTLDLPVTETLWRLLDDHATCVDVGANIGYMTSVMAARLRNGGTVHSFEPLPQLLDLLEANIRRWQPLTRASIQLHRCALGEHTGPAVMHLPRDFGGNQGTATLSPPAGSEAFHNVSFSVACCRLDDLFNPDCRIDVLKVDAERHELAVFRGASRLLAIGGIRDIVFEEHDGPEASSLRFVKSHGYSIFRVARGRSGPALVAPETPLPNELDPATYLATRDPHRALRRFGPTGWLVFRDARGAG